MSNSFYIGAVGLDAQQQALDTIANNISNISSTAFKRSEVRFSELMARQPDAPLNGANLPGASASGAGVRSEAMFLMNEQGKLQATANPMDLAIEGAGFIELIGSGGRTLLWRGGALKVGAGGELMTASGQELKAAISIPVDSERVEITPDGVVRVKASGSDEMTEVGQIELVRIEDPASVEPLDGGLLQVRDGADVVAAKPGEDGAGLLVQGSLERSTVELNQEMVQLMMVQRAYAANAQVVQAADQLMALANNLKK